MAKMVIRILLPVICYNYLLICSHIFIYLFIFCAVILVAHILVNISALRSMLCYIPAANVQIFGSK